MTEDNITSRFLALRQRLRLTAKRLLGSADDADDALQDFFVKLWSKSNFEDGNLSEALMSTMMRNQCIDTLRKKAAKGIHVDIDEMRDISSDNESATCEALYDEVNYIINANLSDLQREILMLHDRDGLEYDVISRQLGMSIDAVRANVSRARNTIRKIYRDRNQSNNKQDVRL